MRLTPEQSALLREYDAGDIDVLPAELLAIVKLAYAHGFTPSRSEPVRLLDWLGERLAASDAESVKVRIAASAREQGVTVADVVQCDRCGTRCSDFRQRDRGRVCILCVERELDQERANAAALRADLQRLTDEVQRVSELGEGQG